MVVSGDGHDRSYIRSKALYGFAEFVEARNGNPLDLLEPAGIAPRALDDPDMLVSFIGAGRLLEHAARKLGIAAFGLEWALSIPAHFPNAGPLLLLREATMTFGEWAERSMQYWRAQTNAITPLVVPKPGSGLVAIRISPRWPRSASRQQIEHILGTILRLTRAAVASGELNPVQVCFRHQRPEATDAHDLLFRCPVEFGAGHDEMWFPAETFRRPMCTEAEVLETLTEDFLRQRISSLPRYIPSASTSTKLAIQTLLGAGICSKEFVALALASSPQKLQRHLAREGTSYEDILDSIRRELACEFLANSIASISAIGGMLDFTTDAALTLAMRRWTGMTPRDFRRAARTDIRE